MRRVLTSLLAAAALASFGCIDRQLLRAVEARSATDLDCPAKDVTVLGSASWQTDESWAAFGCERVAWYACRSKAGFTPTKLGGPVAVDNGAYICVRLWIDEVVQ